MSGAAECEQGPGPRYVHRDNEPQHQSPRVDCGGAMTTIPALVLDRASIQAFDVGKVQLGWRASAVRLREGDENLEIRLNGVSQARA